jgi:RHS repeat-associated protein
MYYTYDGNGKLVSINLNSQEYYYIRNAQGDIIALSDRNGTIVVNYTYDSWGKLISISGTEKDTVGVKNPYRYRGYRYDVETGLYYLQSRYYNPEWGRFINADAIAGAMGELLGHNIFAYCKNNPINMQDSDGFIAMANDGDCSSGGGLETLPVPEPIINKVNNYGGSPRGAGINSAVDLGISSAISKLVSTTKTVVLGNAMTKYSTNTAALGLKNAASIGIVSGTFTGISGAINFSTYGTAEATGRTAFDAGGLIIAWGLVNGVSKYTNKNTPAGKTALLAAGIGINAGVSWGVGKAKDATISLFKRILN